MMPKVEELREQLEVWSKPQLVADFESAIRAEQREKDDIFIQAVRKSQDVLARHLPPDGITALKAIDELLGILDERFLVVAIRQSAGKPEGK